MFMKRSLYFINVTKDDISLKWHGCELFRKYYLKDFFQFVIDLSHE